MFIKRNIKPILTTGLLIVLFFVAASFFDILLVFLYPRFYSNAAFIVTFGVGGIFAGVFGYMYGIEKAYEKNNRVRWSLIILLIITGQVFFFLLAKLEGGEYEYAFKAFGLTLALSTLLFVTESPD